MLDECLLDVLILTHNHEKFIEKCLLSVLDQDCSYKYRIVVLDDCSTDNTFTILNRIKSSSSFDITLMRNNENLGVLKSVRILNTYAVSKYNSFLDGDDEWCYPKKLQTQLDFLEQNSQFAGSFHDAFIRHHYDEKHEVFLTKTQNEWKTYSQFNRYREVFADWDLIERNIIPTASLIFRRSNLTDFFNNFNLDIYSLSWAIHLELLKNNKFKYFNEPWSVYNDHPRGISKTQPLSTFKHSNIKILKYFAKDKSLHFKLNCIYKTITNEYRQILVDPQWKDKRKVDFYKTLMLFIYFHLKTLKYELENIFEYKRNLKKN